MIPEQQFMFKHVDPRRSPGENARKNRASVARERAAGWRVTSENADKVYFERSKATQETAMAKKPAKKPDKTEKKYPDTKYPPRKRKPRKGY